MKKFLIYSIGLLLLAGCNPSVDAKYWESELKPEMAAHKTYLMAFDHVCKSSYVKRGGNPDDKLRNRHMTDALKYIQTYVRDSLDAYLEVAYLHDYLSVKDTADELFVENYEEEEDAETVLAAAFLGALLGVDEMPEDTNYTKEYVLEISELLQQQFNTIDLVLDAPEFKNKTKERITYSVYCPTNNEHYTLTYGLKTKDYNWDVSSK